MLRTQTWLTNKAVDEITEEAEEYDAMRKEFIDILASEENLGNSVSARDSGKPQLWTIMEESWTLGTFWYSLALASPTVCSQSFTNKSS